MTSGNRSLALSSITKAALPTPRVLITADDVTAGKPAPEPYLLAAHQIHQPPERCVVLEDSPGGLTAAREAGMPTIAPTSTHHTGELTPADPPRELNIPGSG